MSDGTVIFNKLVRDNIPEKIAAEGKRALITIVRGEEEIEAIRRKIVEEANEVASASTREETISELADLSEAIKALQERLDIKDVEITEEAQRKRMKSGKFDEGYFLISVSSESVVDLVRNRMRGN